MLTPQNRALLFLNMELLKLLQAIKDNLIYQWSNYIFNFNANESLRREERGRLIWGMCK